MHHTPGVETTTGPLGQGVGNAVGMALAERMLAARYNRPGHEIVDHYTYTICSDGDLQEGVSGEASSHRRAPRPRPADVLLRRQPHLDRGRHRPVVHRGRGRALPRLRLARAALRRHLDARHAARRHRRGTRRSAAEHDHPAHAHRARRAEQAGHGERPRRAARRRRDPPHEARLRLAGGRRLPGARRGRASTATAAPRARRCPPPGQDAFDAYRAAHPDLAAEFERTQAGTPPDDFADAPARVHPGRRRDGDPRGGRQGAAGARRRGAGAGRRLGRPRAVHQHADEGVRQRHGRRLQRPQLPLGHPRARHGLGAERPRRPRRPARASARRSSSSPTTCGRPCASPRSWACRSSTSGRTTPSGSARTARRTSRSST